MAKSKIIIIIVLVVCLFLTACGNMTIGLGEVNFTRVHIFNISGEDQCLEVINWHECDIGVEVKTKEYGTLWLSEGTYILCEKDCPICEKVDKVDD